MSETIMITGSAIIRGTPAPKRQPMWLSNLNGKSQRHRLIDVEFPVRVGTLESLPVVLSNMSTFNKHVERVIEKRGLGEHIIQIVAKVRANDADKWHVFARWDAWTPRWTVERNDSLYQFGGVVGRAMAMARDLIR